MKQHIRNFIFSLLAAGAIAGCGGTEYKDVSEISLNYGGSQIRQRYFLSIRNDGSARYESTVTPEKRTLSLLDSSATEKRSVPIVYSGTISKQQFDDMVNLLNSSGFMSLSSRHDPVTGGNQISITVKYGTQTKEVHDQNGSKGEAFASLEAALEALIDQIIWKRAV
jgi:hypothetical protein